MLVILEKNNIPESIYNWCIKEGRGTKEAKKLAALYVSLHLGESHSEWDFNREMDNAELQALAKALIMDVKHHHHKTNGRHALILASLYLTDNEDAH